MSKLLTHINALTLGAAWLAIGHFIGVRRLKVKLRTRRPTVKPSPK